MSTTINEPTNSDPEVLKKYQATAAGNLEEEFYEFIKREPPIPTCFPSLNEALDGGIYPGLIIFGALTSLGKTTFLTQLADGMAQERDVIFLSLEMGKYEIIGKSISRMTYEKCKIRNHAKTTLGVIDGSRRAKYKDEEVELIDECASQYFNSSERLFIFDGIGEIDVNKVRDIITKHIDLTGNIPVVFIDYLHVLSPTDEHRRSTERQIVEYNVSTLRRISYTMNVPIIAISSFNRDNYNAPVNLSSFKESGLIEYSADIILGMQLYGMDKLKSSDAKKIESIAIIEKLKMEEPRTAQLKILKQRFGPVGLSLYFKYQAKFNHFEETDEPSGSKSDEDDILSKLPNQSDIKQEESDYPF